MANGEKKGRDTSSVFSNNWMGIVIAAILAAIIAWLGSKVLQQYQGVVFIGSLILIIIIGYSIDVMRKLNYIISLLEKENKKK